jgi:hypothetical protein
MLSRRDPIGPGGYNFGRESMAPVNEAPKRKLRHGLSTVP